MTSTEKSSKKSRVFCSDCGKAVHSSLVEFDSPVITSFARHSTPVSDVPFPAVTICPESKVLRSVMEFTKINIFYDRGTFFAVRKSERYGITDFMANCGGLLGLFTGFSVITAIEICYFASLRIFCRLHERRKVTRADVEDTETRA
ncbi:hypothetical protein B566_EDAN002155 [Ephemera danica]|nr:hypothetical protein B566_EDAN002155 [Ephemera danica]